MEGMRLTAGAASQTAKKQREDKDFGINVGTSALHKIYKEGSLLRCSDCSIG